MIMEIERSFSFKIFFILLGIIFIPLIILLLYILKIETQVNATENTTVFLLVSLLALVLAIIGALSITKPLYNRISKYNEIARKIAGGMFELRLPIDSEDELGKLGRFFNMLTKEHHEIKKKGVGEKLFEREKIQAILKNIGDGVIVTDNSNQIELVNSVAEKWFGITQKESPKFHIEDIIQDEQLLELIEKVKHGENQNDEKVEILIKPANLNKEIVLQAIATKVISENRKLYGVAIAFRDLTKEKEIDRKKTEVVSMVSHELRSPLTSIAGFSELLLDENLTREKAED
ncbi:MAG TPA: HAMP domain-containing sensor histidine kinase, partial [Desulfobacterales bacterium]|nr:HAMP domain-containing sensor histidine kinase [Desulfobacterales bacterium]